MNLDWWPTAQFLGQLEFAGTVFGAAFAVECLLPATRQRSWRALSFNLIAALIFIYLSQLISSPLSAMLDPLRVHLVPVHFPDGAAGSVLQTLAFFLVFDFFFYWLHRSQHAFGWLWAQHRFHHTPEHGDRNFAAFFPLWDRVFGTYLHPRPGQYPQVGVKDATDGNTLYDATLYPIVEWGKAIMRSIGVLSKPAQHQ